MHVLGIMKLKELGDKNTRIEILQVLDGGYPNTQIVIALDWNALLKRENGIS